MRDRTQLWILVTLILLPAAVLAQGQGPDPAAEADRLAAEGIAAVRRQDLATALDRLNAALPLAEGVGDKRRIALILNSLAGVKTARGHTEEAVADAERAQALLEEVGTAAEKVQHLPILGVVYERSGRLEKALVVYERVLSAAEGTAKPLQIAAVQVVLARVRERSGRLEEALELYRRAGRVIAEGRQWPVLMQTGSEAGRLALRIGRRGDAREQFSLAFAAAVNGGSADDIAAAVQLLIPLLAEEGKWDEAFTHLDRAREALLKRNDPLRSATILALVGHQLLILGQIQRGQDYLAEARKILDKLENPQRLAAVTFMRGFVRMYQGEPDAALPLFERALELGREGTEPATLAEWQQAAGAIHLGKWQPAPAREAFEKALKITQGVPGQPGLATRWFAMGVASYRLGEYRRALSELEKARSAYGTGGLGPHAIGFSTVVALCHLELGELDHAAAALKVAQASREATENTLRAAPELAAFQSVLPANLAGIEALLLHRRQKDDEALAALERSHGSALARWAGDPRRELLRLLPEKDRERLEKADRELSLAGQVVLTAAQRPNAVDPEERRAVEKLRSEAEERERSARLEFSRVETELRARFPQAWRLAEPPQPAPDALRAEAARRPDTLFLSWSLVDERRALVFALGHRDGVRVFPLTAGGADVARRAERWRTALAERRLSEGSEAKAAWKEWLGPVEAAGLLAPGRYRRLVLVADGLLHELPLAALCDAAGKRLVDRFPVSSSLSILPLGAVGKARKQGKGLLCAADPAAPAGAAPPPAQVAFRSGLGALRHAREEARTVARLFPGSLLMEGPEAREGRWKAEAPKHDLLHFATHGVVNARSGLASWLLLAPEKAGSPDDGRLEAREVLGVPLAARLAVLSACETGRGQAAGGDGLLGLAWAFQAAGCPSVIASRWKVDDAATAALIAHLYRRLLAGDTKDTALRAAMLAVRGQPGRAHPYYWGAFVLFGDTSPLASPAATPAKSRP